MDGTPSFVPAPVAAVGVDGLTVKQRRLVVYILKTQEREGRPPTVREMMAFLEVASTSPVMALLAILKRKGYIEETDERQAHGVKLKGLRTVLCFDESLEGRRLKALYLKAYRG